jgi:HEAT repeat protein
MGIYHEVTLEDAQNLFNEDPAATPVFLELLRHPDETVRMMAVFNECNNLELVRAQIAALIDLSLHSSKASARAAAIVTLQSYHQTHPEAFDAEVRQSVISALVESLRDEYDLARMNAASALREIDPVAARQAGVPVPDS